ncbi:crotonase/enoyl-CoA hydratase family protein [Hoeflea prorocentri]|uniref:Crotonase/enoyl-CoA hydratase family protein n=1 Tax=Hoeflea prorocentri TaxID=1922333 RepID=A0A9X3UG17_9HYPH|nr:crotonase/enoyl-CoA hydratase family protein [Hoeflea prorocentri]MCY6380597.1 crotonase/enoyl-CoA hydratase family protein [Hoeflea prorocentri]MDA5398397.1 crotonase/enoyl-CoA hydratase family protein [Hoeflea prorocentri]
MSELESSFFNVDRQGPVVRLSMNRPEKANGMTPDFWTELPRLLQILDSDETVRAVVLTGEGKHFTGGMDLAAFASIAALFSEEPGRAAYALREKILQLQGTFSAIEKVRFPVIAAIHGACIGGGIDMISACDIRLATRDAYFSIEEINIGMTADVGTLQRLPKLISPAIAAELAYTGRRFSAEEAQAFGLISGLADDREGLIAAAMEMARDISTKSPLAIAGVKRNLLYSRDHAVDDGLDYMATWNAGMLRPEDLTKAVQASMAKKQAVFANLLGEGSLAI